MSAIQTHSLSKIYKEVGKKTVVSLSRLDLTVHDNEVFGFLGRNGAGKTTTIKLLCGLLRPTSGAAAIFGEDARTPASRRQVGYLPEQPYFYEYLTPRETVEFYSRLRGVPAADRPNQWKRIAGLLDLEGIADRRIKEFSKGMRQRVGFAIALIGDPPLLILDEPMSGLDPIGRRMIREIILQLRDEKKTIFFSSHVLSDVETLCDRVGILVEGRLALEAPIDQLPGRRLEQVEILVEGLADIDAETIGRPYGGHRRFDKIDRFLVADLNTANTLLQEALAKGGGIRSLQPLQESLEDYFARVQQNTAPVEEAAS